MPMDISKKNMNVSALMQKPEGTKVFVPDGYAVQCSRGKLGQGLQQHPQEFNLRDPNMFRSSWNYNCLHDEHLKKFFRQPDRKQRLVKHGLITPDEKVPCSVKEFNAHMDLLKIIHPEQDTPGFNRRNSNLHLTYQKKGFSYWEKKEQLIKQGSINPYQKEGTEEPDNCVIDFNVHALQKSPPQMKKESEELMLIDLEEEEENFENMEWSSISLESSQTSLTDVTVFLENDTSSQSSSCSTLESNTGEEPVGQSSCSESQVSSVTCEGSSQSSEHSETSQPFSSPNTEEKLKNVEGCCSLNCSSVKESSSSWKTIEESSEDDTLRGSKPYK